jgi:hypothetical protein
VKRILVLVGIALIALLAINRQRAFLRDPLGKVYRNEVRLHGVQVYINYSNDVLVAEPGQHPYLVQGWNKVPGLPQPLTCLHGMLCWTDADHASMVTAQDTAYSPDTTMSNREVTFKDRDGSRLRITLR